MAYTYQHPPLPLSSRLAENPKNPGERKIVKGRRRKKQSDRVIEEIDRKKESGDNKRETVKGGGG